MRIVFFGDVVGESGRGALVSYMQKNKDSNTYFIANGENAAHGFGITESIANTLFNSGIHVITTGNHAFDQKNTDDLLRKNHRVLRPLNYPKNTPGFGFTKIQNLLVINVMGRLFMENFLNDPFEAIENVISQNSLKEYVIFIDLHAETTSEKQAFGHYFDGRVSVVVGTHTHVPTADARILERGTAYMTDVGMCGDYNSVIGNQKKAAIARFIEKYPKQRLEPAKGPGTICAVEIKIDDTTHKALSIKPIVYPAFR